MSHSHWTDAEDRVRMARRLIADRRWREALEQLRAAVAINPYNADWHVHIGRALDELGRHDEAIDAYSDAIELSPEHLHAHNHLGIALHHLGRNQDAITVFKKLEELDPEFEPSYCNRIRCYAEMGEHQLAEEMFYTARLYRDHCPTCYFNIGVSLAGRGQLEKAIFCWQRTIDLAGDDVHVRAKIAQACRDRGLDEQARKHYLEALKIEPSHVPTLVELATLLVQADRLDEAERRIDLAEALAPMSASVHFVRAKALVARSRHEAAEVSLRRTLQLDPTFAGANLLLAQIAIAGDDVIRAKAFLRAELVLRPESAKVLLDLSNLLIDVDELRLAIACLKRLTYAEPTNVKAWQNLGVAECLRGKHERGIDAFLRAMEVDALNVSVRHNLALAYLECRELVFAREEIEQALRIAPRDRALKRLMLRLRIASMRHRVGRVLGMW